MDEIYKLDAWEIADHVRSGEVSAKEVLEHFLERIDTFNDDLNAIVHLDVQGARDQAAAIDSRVASKEDPGPLGGVPIGVKELEDVEGMPSTHGSMLFKDNLATRDSIQVMRLRAAGCVVVGKTSAPEFGAAAYTSTKIHGTCKNPWNLERTPGGSSGGSAAAVAAGILPIATGSDGGGSIRIPASYSGLFGIKGTFGRIPRGSAADSSLTTVYGPMARSVRDAARFLDCVVGADERDPLSLPHPGMSYEKSLRQAPGALRAVWSSDLGFGVCSEEVARIAKEAAKTFASEEAFEWVDRKVELKDPSVAWNLLGAPATMARLKDYWPDQADVLGPLFAAGIKLAEKKLDVHGWRRQLSAGGRTIRFLRNFSKRSISSSLQQRRRRLSVPTGRCPLRSTARPSSLSTRSPSPIRSTCLAILPCRSHAAPIPMGCRWACSWSGGATPITSCLLWRQHTNESIPGRRSPGHTLHERILDHASGRQNIPSESHRW